MAEKRITFTFVLQDTDRGDPVSEADIVFVWFTGRSLVEGEDYAINFTVKDYGEYNNILQTEVTRCHIVSGPEKERSLDE